jgi:fatty acid desaturase
MMSVGAIVMDWSIIAVAFAAIHFAGFWALPLALLLIGNRQRALMALVHDASHFALHSSKRVNDRLAEYALCAPMLTAIEHYRAMHLQHHVHLGDETLDTDFLHSEKLMKDGIWRIYASQLLSLPNLKTALLGALPSLSARDRLRIAAWWACALSLSSAALGLATTACFALVWIAARLTVYHAIISFVIISDHFGLKPGTIMGFTRNHPAGGLASWLLHPHSNGLHLTHHLMPGLPFHSLKRANEILLGWHRYAAAEHCRNYFTGSQSVLRSWCGETTSKAPLEVGP